MTTQEAKDLVKAMATASNGAYLGPFSIVIDVAMNYGIAREFHQCKETGRVYMVDVSGMDVRADQFGRVFI